MTAVHRVAESIEMDEETFEEEFGFPKFQKEDNVMLYCRTGVRSDQAARILLANGFSNVKNYKGSFQEWFGFVYDN